MEDMIALILSAIVFALGLYVSRKITRKTVSRPTQFRPVRRLDDDNDWIFEDPDSTDDLRSPLRDSNGFWI